MTVFILVLVALGAISSCFTKGFFVLKISYLLAITATVVFLLKGDYWVLLRLVLGLVSFQVSYVVFGVACDIWLSRRRSEDETMRYLRRVLDDPSHEETRRRR